MNEVDEWEENYCFHMCISGSYENVKLILSFQAVNLKSIFGSKCPKMVNLGPDTINRLLFFLML